MPRSGGSRDRAHVMVVYANEFRHVVLVVHEDWYSNRLPCVNILHASFDDAYVRFVNGRKRITDLGHWCKLYCAHDPKDYISVLLNASFTRQGNRDERSSKIRS